MRLCGAQGEHALEGLPAGIAAEVDVGEVLLGEVLLGEVGGFECRSFAVRSEESFSAARYGFPKVNRCISPLLRIGVSPSRLSSTR